MGADRQAINPHLLHPCSPLCILLLTVTMKFTAVTTIAVLAASAAANPTPNPSLGSFFNIFSEVFPSQVIKPVAPWLGPYKSLPGWCGATQFGKLPKLGWGDKNLCSQWWFQFTPFCKGGNKPCKPPVTPPPTGPVCDDGYEQTQKNATYTPTAGVYAGQTVGAAVNDPSYITYGIVANIDECLASCDAVSGCLFVNYYADRYPPGETPSDLPPSAQLKYQDGAFTCSLYSACQSNSTFVNVGGQNDPSYITNSSGWCKSGRCTKS